MKVFPNRCVFALSMLLGWHAVSATVTAQVFVSYGTTGNYRIGQYDFNTAPINSTLIASPTEGYGRSVIVGDRLFVTTLRGTVAEYTLSGALVNPSVISGLVSPAAIAYSHGLLFVASRGLGSAMGQGAVGAYTIAGQTVNAALITGLNSPSALAISGTSLYVADTNLSQLGGTVGLYTTGGQTVNAALISNLVDPRGLTVAGAHLYVSNYGSGAQPNDGYVSRYSLSGQLSSLRLINALKPTDIAAVGDDLYVLVRDNFGNEGWVVRYNAQGVLLNSQQLSNPAGLSVVPEPTAATLLVFGVGALGLMFARRTFQQHRRSR